MTREAVDSATPALSATFASVTRWVLRFSIMRCGFLCVSCLAETHDCLSIRNKAKVVVVGIVGFFAWFGELYPCLSWRVETFLTAWLEWIAVLHLGEAGG